MDESGLRNNYIFTLVKLVIFLLIFCFLVTFTKELWQELRSKEGFRMTVLILSLLSSFAFSAFVIDLAKYYKNIQGFFFRNSFATLVVPSILIVLAIGYFFLPKLAGVRIDRDVFVFLGGFTLTTHLVFIANNTKGHNFTTVINYLFIFSILYLLNLLLFSGYLRIAFNINIWKVIVEGIKEGAALIQSIFTQVRR